MLATVNKCISNLPPEPFSIFYQNYIIDLENRILDQDVTQASLEYKSIEDITLVIKGLNKMTEELR